MRILPINEEALLVEFEKEISLDMHLKVKFYSQYIDDHMVTIDIVTAYSSILVTYDYTLYDFDDFKKSIEGANYKKSAINNKKSIVYIPVCYEKNYQLDISRVATLNKLTVEEVIIKHTEPIYLVHMIGFTPGFPYLGGMNQELSTDRLAMPRFKIEAGSVGIGGNQTGIYPAATPGGWNIIGRTPLPLFDIHKDDPSLLKMGDYIKFESISSEIFDEISHLIEDKCYKLKVEVRA